MFQQTWLVSVNDDLVFRKMLFDQALKKRFQPFIVSI